MTAMFININASRSGQSCAPGLSRVSHFTTSLVNMRQANVGPPSGSGLVYIMDSKNVMMTSL